MNIRLLKIYFVSTCHHFFSRFIDWQPHLSFLYKLYFESIKGNSRKYKLDSKVFMRLFLYTLYPNIELLDNFDILLRLMNISTLNDRHISDFINNIPSLIDERTFIEQSELWYNFTPKTHCLDTKTINKIGMILLKKSFDLPINQLKYLKDTKLEKLILINNIDDCLKKILKQLKFAEENVSEKFRLEMSLKYFSASLNTLFTMDLVKDEHRLLVIDLLINLASSLNLSDDDLCSLQLTIIQKILNLGLPLIDYSNANFDELNELEQTICFKSAQLEEFVLIMVDFFLNLFSNSHNSLFLSLRGKNDNLFKDIFINLFMHTSEANFNVSLLSYFNEKNNNLIKNILKINLNFFSRLL